MNSNLLGFSQGLWAKLPQSKSTPESGMAWTKLSRDSASMASWFIPRYAGLINCTEVASWGIVSVLVLTLVLSWDLYISDLFLEPNLIQLKHGIGADLIFSWYFYATEELIHKGALYKSYAERHCKILFARKLQAADIALWRYGL